MLDVIVVSSIVSGVLRLLMAIILRDRTQTYSSLTTLDLISPKNVKHANFIVTPKIV